MTAPCMTQQQTLHEQRSLQSLVPPFYLQWQFPKTDFYGFNNFREMFYKGNYKDLTLLAGPMTCLRVLIACESLEQGVLARRFSPYGRRALYCLMRKQKSQHFIHSLPFLVFLLLWTLRFYSMWIAIVLHILQFVNCMKCMNLIKRVKCNEDNIYLVFYAFILFRITAIHIYCILTSYVS